MARRWRLSRATALLIAASIAASSGVGALSAGEARSESPTPPAPVAAVAREAGAKATEGGADGAEPEATSSARESGIGPGGQSPRDRAEGFDASGATTGDDAGDGVGEGVGDAARDGLAPPASRRDLESQVKAAAEAVFPALVHIQPVSEDFSQGKRIRYDSAGSGVIVSADGLVLTNYHVAGKATRLLCTLSNKQRLEATLVGGDPWTDLAVIRLDAKAFAAAVGADFRPAVLGETEGLRVGQTVLAMGSPYGFDRSVSMGIISCLDRYLPDGLRLATGEPTGGYSTWLQTDAAINPGNSGGPLVDLRGRVVGINTRVIMFGNSLGFAVPIDTARSVFAQIRDHGRVRRGWLGLRLPSDEEETRLGREAGGVLISGVEENSPAAEVGVTAGEVVVAVNDEPVAARHLTEIPAVRRRLANLPLDRPATLRLKPLFEKGPERTVRIQPIERGGHQGEDFDCPRWGMTVRGMTRAMARELRVGSTEGVMVLGVERGGAADLAGLRQGDVIVRLEASPAPDLERFRQMYAFIDHIGQVRTAVAVQRARQFLHVLLDTDPQ